MYKNNVGSNFGNANAAMSMPSAEERADIQQYQAVLVSGSQFNDRNKKINDLKRQCVVIKKELRQCHDEIKQFDEKVNADRKEIKEYYEWARGMCSRTSVIIKKGPKRNPKGEVFFSTRTKPNGNPQDVPLTYLHNLFLETLCKFENFTNTMEKQYDNLFKYIDDTLRRFKNEVTVCQHIIGNKHFVEQVEKNGELKSMIKHRRQQISCFRKKVTTDLQSNDSDLNDDNLLDGICREIHPIDFLIKKYPEAHRFHAHKKDTQRKFFFPEIFEETFEKTWDTFSEWLRTREKLVECIKKFDLNMKEFYDKLQETAVGFDNHCAASSPSINADASKCLSGEISVVPIVQKREFPAVDSDDHYADPSSSKHVSISPAAHNDSYEQGMEPSEEMMARADQDPLPNATQGPIPSQQLEDCCAETAMEQSLGLNKPSYAEARSFSM